MLVVLVLAAFARPLGLTLAFNDRKDARTVTEAADWIAANTDPWTVIMDLPTVSNLIFRYDRPTVVVPHGPVEDTFAAARRFNAELLVVSARTILWRPGLAPFWETDGRQVRLREAGAGLFEPVWADATGQIVIARFVSEAYTGSH